MAAVTTIQLERCPAFPAKPTSRRLISCTPYGNTARPCSTSCMRLWGGCGTWRLEDRWRQALQLAAG